MDFQIVYRSMKENVRFSVFWVMTKIDQLTNRANFQL